MILSSLIPKDRFKLHVLNWGWGGVGPESLLFNYFPCLLVYNLFHLKKNPTLNFLSLFVFITIFFKILFIHS